VLTDNDLAYVYNENDEGIALAWVIGEDVLYDVPLPLATGKLFLECTRVEDVSVEYSEHEGISVRLFKGDAVLTDLQTSEYFGSILLSKPKVVNLDNHKNGSFVVSPNAKFINYEFVVDPEFNPRELDPWYPHAAPENGNVANCTKLCNCGIN
jgi:hypothetical protein